MAIGKAAMDDRKYFEDTVEKIIRTRTRTKKELEDLGELAPGDGDIIKEDYKDQVNMQLITTDGKKFVGDYIIPQDEQILDNEVCF